MDRQTLFVGVDVARVEDADDVACVEDAFHHHSDYEFVAAES